METWSAIPGYEGRYEVSDMGRVRSLHRGKTHVMKGDLHSNGYVTVSIRASHESRTRRRRVHQLVLLAFVGPMPEGNVVRHMNDDRRDNRLSNLQYGTQSDNRRDRSRNQAKVREGYVEETRRLVACNPSLTGPKLAASLGIPVGTAGGILAQVRRELAS